jgi:hypothetical protein
MITIEVVNRIKYNIYINIYFEGIVWMWKTISSKSMILEEFEEWGNMIKNISPFHKLGGNRQFESGEGMNAYAISANTLILQTVVHVPNLQSNLWVIVVRIWGLESNFIRKELQDRHIVEVMSPKIFRD